MRGDAQSNYHEKTTNLNVCFVTYESFFLVQRYNENGTLARIFSERPDFYNEFPVSYRFGLILFHSEMGGTMLSVTSSSRILQRCS